MLRIITTDLITQYLHQLPPPSSFRQADIFRLRDIVVILTLFLSGARAQEVCNLLHRDVQIENDILVFYPRSLKGGKPRRVMARNRSLISYFKKYRALWVATAAAPFVLTSEPNHVLPYPRLIHRIVKRSFPDFSPHSFRHHYASLLIHNNVSFPLVQYSLGHRRADTTAIYLHIFAAETTAEIFTPFKNGRHRH